MRRVAIAFAILAAAFCVAFVRPYGVPFHTANGGFTLLHAGVEVWGHPGFFSCDQVGC